MRRRSGTLVIDFRSGGRPEEYEGEYQCFARNKFGTALSNRIRLQVSSEFQGALQGERRGMKDHARRTAPALSH